MPQPQPQAAPSLARMVLVAVVAEGLLTLMDALIKLLSERYPTLQIAFLRYIFGLAGAAAYAAWSPPGWPTREAMLYNGVRAVIIVVTATTFFFALARLPLADAIALSFISPVLTALLGVLLLGERLDWRIGVALAAGFAGMLLIVGGKVGGGGLEPSARRPWSSPRSATRSTSSCCATAPCAIRSRRSCCFRTSARRSCSPCRSCGCGRR